MEAQVGEPKEEQPQVQYPETDTSGDETSCSLTAPESSATPLDETGDGQLQHQSEGDGDIVTEEEFSATEKLTVEETAERQKTIEQNLGEATHAMQISKNVIQETGKKVQEVTALIDSAIKEAQLVISAMESISQALGESIKEKAIPAMHPTAPAEEELDEKLFISEDADVVSSPADQHMEPSHEGHAGESISTDDGTPGDDDDAHVTQLGDTVTDSATDKVCDEKTSTCAQAHTESDHSGEGHGDGGKKKDQEEEEEKKDEKQHGSTRIEDVSVEHTREGSVVQFTLCLHFTEKFIKDVPLERQCIIHNMLSQKNPVVEILLKGDNSLVYHFPNTPKPSTECLSQELRPMYTINIRKIDWEKIPKSHKKEIEKLLSAPNLSARISLTSDNTFELDIESNVSSIGEPPQDTREQPDVKQEVISPAQQTVTPTSAPTTASQVTTDASHKTPGKCKEKKKHLETDESFERFHTATEHSVGGSGDGRKDDSDDDCKTVTSPAKKKVKRKIDELSLELLRKMSPSQRRFALEQLTSVELRELLLLEPDMTLKLSSDIDSVSSDDYLQNRMLVESLLEWNDKELEEILKMSGRGILMFLKETDVASFRIIDFLQELDVQHILTHMSLSKTEKAKRLLQACLETPNLALLRELDQSVGEVDEELSAVQKRVGYTTPELSLHLLRSFPIKKCKRAIKHLSDEEIIKLLTSKETQVIPLSTDISKKLTREEKKQMETIAKVLTKLKDEKLKQLLQKPGKEILQQLKEKEEIRNLQILVQMEKEIKKNEREQRMIKKMLEGANKQNKLAAKEAMQLLVKFALVENAMDLAQKHGLIKEAIQLGENYGFVKEAIDIAVESGNLDQAIRLAREYGYSAILEELEQMDQAEKQKKKLEEAESSRRQMKLKELKEKGYTNIPLYLSPEVLNVFDENTMIKFLRSLTDEQLVEMLMLEKGKHIKTFLKEERKRCTTPCCMFHKKNNNIRATLLKLISCSCKPIMKNRSGEEILEAIKKKSKRAHLKILEIQKQLLLRKICETDLHVNLLSEELKAEASERLERKTLDEESETFLRQLISSLESQQAEFLQTATQDSSVLEEEETGREVKLYLTYESLRVYHIDTVKNVFKQLADRKILKLFQLNQDEYMEVRMLPISRKKQKKRKKKKGLLGKTLRKMKGAKLRKLLKLSGDAALEKLKAKHENVVLAFLEMNIENLRDELQNKQHYKEKLEEVIKKIKMMDSTEKQTLQKIPKTVTHTTQISSLKETTAPSTSTATSVKIEENDETVTLYIPYDLLRHISTDTVRRIFKRMTDTSIMKLFLSEETECVKVLFNEKRSMEEKRRMKKEKIGKSLLKMKNCKLVKLLQLPGADAFEKLLAMYPDVRLKYFQIEHDNLKKFLAMEKEKNEQQIEQMKKIKQELKIINLQQKKQKAIEKEGDTAHMVHHTRGGTVVGKLPPSDTEVTFTPSKKSIITVDIDDAYAQSVHEKKLQIQIHLKPPIKDPLSGHEVLLMDVDEKQEPLLINIDPRIPSSTPRKVSFSGNTNEDGGVARTLSEITSYQETVDGMKENMIYSKQGVIQKHLTFQNFIYEMKNGKGKELKYYETYLWEAEKETLRDCTQFEHDTGSSNSTFIFMFLFIYFIYKKLRIL